MERTRRPRTIATVLVTVTLALFLLFFAVVVFVVLTSSVSGVANLPGGRVLTIEATGLDGFGAGESAEETFVWVGSFNRQKLTFTDSTISVDGLPVAEIDPQVKRMTLRLLTGQLELVSDDGETVLIDR